MDYASDKPAGSPFAFRVGGETGGLLQVLSLLEESSAKQIEDEKALNNLKLSNLRRLGLLKQGQEAEILQARLAAEKRLIDERAKLMEDALDHEMATERDKRIAAIEETSALERAARIAEIDAEIAEETKARKKQIKELTEYEKKEKEKAAKEEEKEDKKRQKKEAEAKKAEKREENKEAQSNLFGKQKEGETLGEWMKRKKEAASDLFAKTEEGGGKAAGLAYLASNLTSALSNFAKSLENQIDEISSKKSSILFLHLPTRPSRSTIRLFPRPRWIKGSFTYTPPCSTTAIG